MLSIHFQVAAIISLDLKFWDFQNQLKQLNMHSDKYAYI